jgi:hypothetical protein
MGMIKECKHKGIDCKVSCYTPTLCQDYIPYEPEKWTKAELDDADKEADRVIKVLTNQPQPSSVKGLLSDETLYMADEQQYLDSFEFNTMLNKRKAIAKASRDFALQEFVKELKPKMGWLSGRFLDNDSMILSMKYEDWVSLLKEWGI